MVGILFALGFCVTFLTGLTTGYALGHHEGTEAAYRAIERHYRGLERRS